LPDVVREKLRRYKNTVPNTSIVMIMTVSNTVNETVKKDLVHSARCMVHGKRK
jgi:hypothetical protein